jgi:hypothetical protein
MASFPTLKSGTVACWGTSLTQTYGCTVQVCVDGSAFRCKSRLPTTDITLVFTSIEGYDLAKIRAFWISAKGSFDNTWSITIDSTTYLNCCFANDQWLFTEDPGKPNRFSGKLQIKQTI